MRTNAGFVIAVSAWISASGAAGAAEEGPGDGGEPVDRCAYQLRLVREALFEYVERSGRYPEGLGELIPTYLGDPSLLICPEAKRKGDNTSGSVLVKDYSSAVASYEYQFSTAPWSYLDLRGRARKTTLRKLKEAQRRAVGDVVPCIRCFQHGTEAVRNMAFSGALYVTGQYWETEVVDRMALPYLLSGVVEDDRPIKDRVPMRRPGIPGECLDLTTVYNALLSDRWLGGDRDLGVGVAGVGEGGEHWASDGGDGVFDARGVVQLYGAGLAQRSYPSSKLEIPVGKNCRKVNFLHGCFFEADPGTEVAMYRLSFGPGDDVIEVPVRYGHEINCVAAPEGDRSRGDETVPKRERGVKSGGESGGGICSFTWVNSWDGGGARRLKSIDFLSTETVAAPFLLAVTVE